MIKSTGLTTGIPLATLRSFGNFLYPTLPVPFGRYPKSCCGVFNLVSMSREVNDPVPL